MERVGHWLVAHRRMALGAVLALAALAAAGLPQLKTDLDPRALAPGTESLPRSLVAIVDIDGPSANDVEQVAALGDRLLELPGVERVESITHSPLPHVGDIDDEGDDEQLDALLSLIEAAPDRFPGGLASIGERTGGPLVVGPLGANAEALRSVAPRLRGNLLGRSGDTALVVAHLNDLADAPAIAAQVEEEGIAVTGLPLLERDLVQELQRDPIVLIVLAALANVLVLWIGFRRRAGIALPMLTAGVTIALVIGVMGWLGMPLTLLDMIVPPLLLTLGVSDAVHLVSREGEERLTSNPTRSAERSFTVMARACLATSVTTAIGFGSLLIADNPAVRRFAMLAVLGVLTAYAVTVFLVPAALPSFPARAKPPTSPLLDRIGRFATERRAWVFLGAGLVLAGSAGLATRVDTGMRLLDPFDEAHPRVATTRVLEAEHGGLRRLHVDADDLEDMAAWLREQPEVLQTRSGLDLLDGIWDRIGTGERPTTLTAELEQVAITAGAELPEGIELGLRDLTTDEITVLADRIRERGGAVSGEAWVTAQGLDSLTSQLVLGFALALAIIVLVLSFLLRSPRLGLLSLPPNLLPLAVVLGWMGLRDIPLTASTAMVFAVSLGLVVDGTIHLFMRFREEREQKDPIEAAQRTVRHSGRAVVLGGLTLLAGFAPILASHFEPLARFAELSVVAILAAIVAELLLTPALLSRTR